MDRFRISWFTFILFITDWVGEEIFGGDPFAGEGSDSRAAYDVSACSNSKRALCIFVCNVIHCRMACELAH